MPDELKHCNFCNLILEGGATHATHVICIQAMQVAMLNQRRAAEGMGQAISAQFLSILEQLAANSGDTGGLFRTILSEYRAMGDWSLIDELRENLKAELLLNKRFQDVLAETEELCVMEIPFNLRVKIRDLLDPSGMPPMEEPQKQYSPDGK